MYYFTITMRFCWGTRLQRDTNYSCVQMRRFRALLGIKAMVWKLPTIWQQHSKRLCKRVGYVRQSRFHSLISCVLLMADRLILIQHSISSIEPLIATGGALYR